MKEDNLSSKTIKGDLINSREITICEGQRVFLRYLTHSSGFKLN